MATEIAKLYPAILGQLVRNFADDSAETLAN
eukprot:SAG31_NODE_4951_length_2837_cov_6.891892_3_plen_31_part_00